MEPVEKDSSTFLAGFFNVGDCKNFFTKKAIFFTKFFKNKLNCQKCFGINFAYLYDETKFVHNEGGVQLGINYFYSIKLVRDN